MGVTIISRAFCWGSLVSDAKAKLAEAMLANMSRLELIGLLFMMLLLIAISLPFRVMKLIELRLIER